MPAATIGVLRPSRVLIGKWQKSPDSNHCKSIRIEPASQNEQTITLFTDLTARSTVNVETILPTWCLEGRRKGDELSLASYFISDYPNKWQQSCNRLLETAL